jgi:hypothetical protein
VSIGPAVFRPDTHRAAWALVGWSVLGACAGQARVPVPWDGEDTGQDAIGAPPPAGRIVLDACLGETGVPERCTLVTDATACTSAPCDRLVVVFSGGDMACDSGDGYERVLRGYAGHGYAAVCINAFDTATGSGAAPFVDEAGRFDIAMREATTGAWARTYWNGQHLLIEGISHGATAPMILMARTSLDEQPHWRGRRATAGCFFDGSYDQVATAELLRTGGVGGRACTAPVSHARWLERYCGDGATAATCDLALEPRAALDSITEIPTATFAIDAFTMFECGSARPTCTGDIIPAAPIERLCHRLDGSPSHACTLERLPDDGHLTCHRDHFDRCRAWFDMRFPR